MRRVSFLVVFVLLKGQADEQGRQQRENIGLQSCHEQFEEGNGHYKQTDRNTHQNVFEQKDKTDQA